MDAPCQFPRCRQPGVLIYMGRDVCCGHWNEITNCDVENETLKRIHLTRNDQGEVIELDGAAGEVQMAVRTGRGDDYADAHAPTI